MQNPASAAQRIVNPELLLRTARNPKTTIIASRSHSGTPMMRAGLELNLPGRRSGSITNIMSERRQALRGGQASRTSVSRRDYDSLTYPVTAKVALAEPLEPWCIGEVMVPTAWCGPIVTLKVTESEFLTGRAVPWTDSVP